MPRQRGPFQIGSVIKGRYKIVREVGCGGFAVVYKAHEKQLRRFVAIKALTAPGNGSDQSKQRFVDEARKLADIANQHVVTVYNNGNHEGVRYFVMEYLPYSLADLLKGYFDDSPVEHELAVRILKQTLEGLAEVHDRGWTHRDIKPQNILLTEDDEVRLADFGLIKDPDAPRTEEGANPGTPAWMAPEQRKGRAVSTETDIYAFGLVAFRMISGEQWTPQHPVDLSQFTDRGTARLVLQCLKQRPSARPRTLEQYWWNGTRSKTKSRRKSSDRPFEATH